MKMTLPKLIEKEIKKFIFFYHVLVQGKDDKWLEEGVMKRFITIQTIDHKVLIIVFVWVFSYATIVSDKAKEKKKKKKRRVFEQIN